MMYALREAHKFFSTHPLTRDAPLRGWGRLLSWQVRSRLQREVLVPWIADQKLVVRRGMTGATGNIYAGLHEYVNMILLLHFLRPGDLFLDVGANVGSYTVLASGVCRAETWAFEPDPVTADALRKNVAVNDLAALVAVHQCALGATRGEVAFTVGLDTINHVATDEADVRVVRLERLDDLAAEASPIMMKMDIEGYEEEVIRGAEALLSGASLKLIELETVTPYMDEIFAKNGFEVGYYDPTTRALSRTPLTDHLSNAIFVRDWDFVAERLASAEKVKIFHHLI